MIAPRIAPTVVASVLFQSIETKNASIIKCAAVPTAPILVNIMNCMNVLIIKYERLDGVSSRIESLELNTRYVKFLRAAHTKARIRFKSRIRFSAIRVKK